MTRTQTWSTATIAMLGVLAVPASGTAATKVPPGFQVDFGPGNRTHVECFSAAGVLRCLDYSNVRTPGRCTAGGDVDSVVLPARARAQRTYVCVDEAFHAWPRLRAARPFRSGPYRCRLRARRAELYCSSGLSGRSFRIRASGIRV